MKLERVGLILRRRGGPGFRLPVRPRRAAVGGADAISMRHRAAGSGTFAIRAGDSTAGSAAVFDTCHLLAGAGGFTLGTCGGGSAAGSGARGDIARDHTRAGATIGGDRGTAAKIARLHAAEGETESEEDMDGFHDVFLVWMNAA